MALVAEHEDVGTERVAMRFDRRLSGWALAAICVVSAVLYAWAITSEGWGNSYYAAAVKSMSQNLTNFLFGSFDPAGVVTVDKPPLAFWPMVASAALFGYHGWSLLLPQVIEGVAAVFLLHRTVRRWAGEPAALIAALVLALTPVTVAINRDTNPDTMMLLVLVAAAYAVTRCIEKDTERGAVRWLMLASILLGLGFLAKQLQAWIVVPAFLLAYLTGATVPWGRRILRLLGAGVVTVASAGWWVLLTVLWPQPKPYIGGSTDGTELNLVFGYNGFGRLSGQGFGGRGGGARGAGPPVEAGGAPGGLPGEFGGPGGGGFGGGGPFGGGQAGIGRLFTQTLAGQISWLLPLALLVLVVATVVGVSRMRSGLPGNATGRAGWFLWGCWLLAVGLVLSYDNGIMHPYYTTEMAPAIAALTGAGVTLLWKHYRSPAGYTWLLLPAAVVLTAAWAWVVVSYDPSWNGWLRYAVAAVAVVAVVALVLGRSTRHDRGSWMPRAAVTLAIVTLLLAPGVWSGATAFARTGGGAMAQAGPPNRGFGGIAQQLQQNSNPALREIAGRFAQGQGRGGPGGMDNAQLSDQQRKILAYAESHSNGARLTLAVDGGANAAATYIINSNATVTGMGGFSGSDPAPTVQQLATWVQQGQLRFVLLSPRSDPRGDQVGQQPGGTIPGQANGEARRGGFGGFLDNGVAQQRQQWVQQNCTIVDPSAYGAAQSSQQDEPGPFGGAQALYECGAK